MKRILLDCDGVLADFSGRVLGIINRVTGREHILAGWNCWAFGDAFRLTRAQRAAVVRRIKTTGFCRDLSVMPGATDGVRMLAERGEITVVTSPWASPTWEAERRAWLSQRLGIERVIFATDKRGIDGDVLIDDHAGNVEAWKEGHPDGLAVLWDAHHNRTEAWTPRARSWQEVCEWIR